ncbi:MAG: TonB-dependent receptor, partial [Pyrinomonadaceae bacterium]
LASSEYEHAKLLDPRDPTPWFYDAIQKQTTNRPVEALHDLQKAIDLNDNRAVYRSKLLLDEDLAARGAAVGRNYNELLFQQLALVEGWKSINVDPTDYSSHRLLADTYSALPRHEIASVSELLQSQLLQPLNITPVQPQLAESDLFLLGNLGPAEPSLNEFNPLFLRDQFRLLTSGFVGSQETYADEAVHSALWKRLSYSLGQFHYETDGVRDDNDLKQDIYNVFFQAIPFFDTSIQFELRRTDIREGDRVTRFFPEDFRTDVRQDREIDIVRFGLHHQFAPGSDLIASFIHKSTDGEFDSTSSPGGGFRVTFEEESFLYETQHLWRTSLLHLVSGIGHFNTTDRRLTLLGIDEEKGELSRTNLYLYSHINYPEQLQVTIGMSADLFNGTFTENDRVNPKLGVMWQPFPGTILRAAAFSLATRGGLSIAPTIEPAQVAGFAQDVGRTTIETDLENSAREGVDEWRYGVGVDQKLSPDLYAGAEISNRELDVPGQIIVPGGLPETVHNEWEEALARGYLYWTPDPWFKLNVEYFYEHLDRGTGFVARGTGVSDVETHRVPMGIGFFHPSGFSAGLTGTYHDQSGDFVDRTLEVRPGSD